MRLNQRTAFRQGARQLIQSQLLTKKQERVIRLRVSGLKREQVAEILGITVHAVDFHSSRVYRRLGVNCLLDAIYEIERRRAA